MSDNQANQPHPLAEAASILRTCQPLSDHLMAEGITIELSKQEQQLLLNFEKLLLTGYSETEWSYLRVASGLKVREVAILTSCLSRFRISEQKPIYGQL